MRGDGDGWVFSSDGSRHWGRHGAAGLLLRAPASPSGSAVLLQHRAAWSHQGGTWALPGGARDSHESAVHAAVREAGEEAGITADLLTVRDEHVTALEDSGWSYTTVVADASEQLSTVLNGESTELRWVDEHDVDALPLHPAFATSWPSLRTVPVSVVLAPDVDADVPPSPRTVRLAVGRFGWVVEVHRPVDVLAALRGHDENTVVVTGDGDLASSVPADVIVLPPALF